MGFNGVVCACGCKDSNLNGKHQQREGIVDLSKPQMARPIMMGLADNVDKEVQHNVEAFFGLGLIGEFRGLQLNLSKLHKWISKK